MDYSKLSLGAGFAIYFPRVSSQDWFKMKSAVNVPGWKA